MLKTERTGGHNPHFDGGTTRGRAGSLDEHPVEHLNQKQRVTSCSNCCCTAMSVMAFFLLISGTVFAGFCAANILPAAWLAGEAIAATITIVLGASSFLCTLIYWCGRVQQSARQSSEPLEDSNPFSSPTTSSTGISETTSTTNSKET